MKRVTLILVGLLAVVCASAQALGDFRSAVSGNWATPATWQRFDGTSWLAATAAPAITDGVITIQATHTVTIAASASANQVLVSTGATLQTAVAAGITFTINGTNGQAGSELTINGRYNDQSTTGGIAFTNGGTWDMGAAGTLMKTTATSSNNWQNNYEGGIANIPATANWILRKTGTSNPALSTTAPATGAVYPNLTIENNTGAAWTTPNASSFTGTSAFATVKGNLDIGGSGSNVVSFLNDGQHATGYTLVMGNVTVRSGNTFRNYGNGTEIQGNFIVAGTVLYDSNHGRKLIFSGGGNQTISGAGTLNVYDLVMNKSANGVTLNRAVTVDNNATFTSGVMYSTATNLLIFADNATATGASSSSFVSGPVRKMAEDAFTFPIGKNTDYQPLGVSASAISTFWTENFGTGCSQFQSANNFSGTGTWTVASTGINDAFANQWFVSATEAGMGAGVCGDGCLSSGALTDRSLHVANVPGSPLDFFCPTGDCGAAYDAGFGTNDVRTNIRAESPAINCTGRYNVQVYFEYMESGGSDAQDNFTLWYYDGSAWSQIADPADASTCPLGQGLWTAYTITLPASADNNANVRIGFNWTNDDDGAGGDPSVAIDNIAVSESYHFTAEYFYANPQTTYNNVLASGLNAISACEYWILDRIANSSVTKNVTLSWDANSCNVVSPLSDMRVARFDGSMWQDEGNQSTTGTVGAGSVTSNAVSNFSPFTLASVPPTPLPIELLDFTAQYENGNVALRWCTATEINNDFFTVERSSDGMEFHPLLRVEGAGNSTHTLCYDDVDRQPFSGTSYYRLRQTDFNGQYSHSPVRAVQITGEGFSIVNVSSDAQSLYLDLQCPAASPVQVRITDAMGKFITLNQQPCSNRFVFDKANFSPGIYFVTVIAEEKVISRKVFLH